MLSDHLLGLAAEQYDFPRASLRFLAEGRDASRQFYAFEKDEKRYVMRFTMCRADWIGQTRAEMDWLCYLSEKGMGVCRPLRARGGELAVLAKEKRETCIIAAYSMAQGKRWDPNDPALWNEKVFFAWGRAMGEMHRATKDYRPGGTDRRPAYKGMVGGGVRAFPTVHRAAEELNAKIAALPKDNDSYGLIHYDFGPANFLIDGERINVFDFDDCAYAWYALDIGVALTLGLWFGRRSDAGYDFTNDIMEHFLKGYLSANGLSDFWLRKIPMFMRLCQIAGFSLTQRRYSPDDAHQKELIYNIENHIFLTGCAIDDSLFMNGRLP